MLEIERDTDLQEGLGARLRARSDRQDHAFFGRRAIWYCLTRLERPRVLIETGTHDGLGTALLANALRRNAEEGAPGRLHTFDIDPEAGWLASGIVEDVCDFHRGDIRQTLASVGEYAEVDLFIHDSLHTEEQELFEYGWALSRAAERLVLVSDNARTGAADDATESTYALRNLSRDHAAPYAVFRERPLDHFVGGGTAGVGVFRRGG